MWSSRSRRQLPTQRSATPFCQGALDGSLLANDVHGPNRRGLVQTILGVVIKDEELGRGLIGESFA